MPYRGLDRTGGAAQSVSWVLGLVAGRAGVERHGEKSTLAVSAAACAYGLRTVTRSSGAELLTKMTRFPSPWRALGTSIAANPSQAVAPPTR
jgi:hypothetical protein